MRNGFTIIETLAAMAVLLILMVIVFSVIDQASKIWRRTIAKSEQFRNARVGFATLGQNLRQATLNSYLDYDDSSNPTVYLRKSDLHFITGQAASLIQFVAPSPPSIAIPGPNHAIFFQAPIGFSPGIAGATGIPDLLNAVGYFIEFCGDDLHYPLFVAKKNIRYRYRLMEFKQPSANLAVYSSALGRNWFQSALSATSANVRPIADNIVALVIAPRTSTLSAPTALAPNYGYDSRITGSNPQPIQQNQLPPLLDVTMVAIAEESASQLAARYGSAAPPIVDPLWFQNAAKYSDDLNALISALQKGSLVDGKSGAPINYRVFTSTIQLREGK